MHELQAMFGYLASIVTVLKLTVTVMPFKLACYSLAAVQHVSTTKSLNTRVREKYNVTEPNLSSIVACALYCFSFFYLLFFFSAFPFFFFFFGHISSLITASLILKSTRSLKAHKPSLMLRYLNNTLLTEK